MANIEVGLLETEKQLSSMIEASGKTVPQPGERANIVEHLDYIIQLLGTMVSAETFEAAKEKMANGYNAINDRIEIVNWLLASGEISGDVDVEPLTVTENGEYMPGAGKAYSRVVVETPVVEDKVPELLAREFTEFEHSTAEKIGSFALANFSSLTSVNFPACTNIGELAFQSCSSLTSVSFPACTNIGNSAFQYCSSLTSVNFPSCTNIGNGAFQYCSSLTSVDFPACTNIGSDVFRRCSSLTSINFSACTNIGGVAFQSCSSLTSVNFPACTNIGNQAFQNCSSLTSVNFPACTSIGNQAFQNCSSLTSVSFPACTNIGNSAFQSCSSLTSVNFPACTNIGELAFQSCSSLTSVSFPACTSIGSGAFRCCFNLISIYLLGSQICNIPSSYYAPFHSTPIGGYSISAGQYGSVFVPASLVDAYKSAANWSYLSNRIVAYVEP